MANWPRRIADLVYAAKRLLCPRRSRPAPRTRLGLEPLSTRILFSAGLSAYEPDTAAVAALFVSSLEPDKGHYSPPPAAMEQQTALIARLAPFGQNAPDDPNRYAELDWSADRQRAAAEVFSVLLADCRGAEMRHDPPTPAAATSPADQPAAAETPAGTAGSAAQAPPASDRVDGGGIAADLAADEASASRDGTGEIDADGAGGRPPAVLVVDWMLPEPHEDLTPLNKANLAFVPTYVVNEPAVPAAAPARPDGAPDLALAGVVIGPDQPRPAAPDTADSSTGHEKVVDHIFKDLPLPAGDAASAPPGYLCLRLEAGFRLVAVEMGRLLADLPPVCGHDRAAALVLAEALLVLGAWRLTQPDHRAPE